MKIKRNNKTLRKGNCVGKKKNKVNPCLVKMNCDKCCANCSHGTSRGTWLQCMIDNKEVSPNGYYSQYN